MNAKQGPRLTNCLEHMLEAVRLARSYVEGLGKADFLEDRKTQQAVILNILVVGEAATKIANEYPDFVAGRPDIPWRQIRGMRNRMAHGYFEINLDIVWDTVQESLPQLEQQLLELQRCLKEQHGRLP
jgi:uncharacterized protein with HEPN domain